MTFIYILLRNIGLLYSFVFFLGGFVFGVIGVYILNPVIAILSAIWSAIWWVCMVKLWKAKQLIINPQPINQNNKQKSENNKSKQSNDQNKNSNSIKQYKQKDERPFVLKRYKLAGTSFYKDNIESIGFENEDFNKTKQQLIDDCLVDEKIYEYTFIANKIALVEENNNEFDENAVAVHIDGNKVGYIKKGSCSHIKNIVKNNRIKSLDADIFGGNYKIVEYDDEEDSYDLYIEKSKKPNYGVILEIEEYEA